jgi:hypothetical protein
MSFQMIASLKSTWRKTFTNGKPDLQSINETLLDHPGDLIIEEFIKAPVYHVNGYAKDGKISYVWPFVNLNTNLDFTEGKEYGNLSIQPSDKRYAKLIDATQRILDSMSCADHLFFHCELFEHDNQLLLCEIAARKPGLVK